jgi:hypothetical protein
LTLNKGFGRKEGVNAATAELELPGMPERVIPEVGSPAFQAWELEQMAAKMIEEEGLLNFSQAAIVLEVSNQRVVQLVQAGKLDRFFYCGTNYVSYRQVCARRRADVNKGGRPKRGVVQRVSVGVEAALMTDKPQMALGGYAGAYYGATKRGPKPKNRQ